MKKRERGRERERERDLSVYARKRDGCQVECSMVLVVLKEIEGYII